MYPIILLFWARVLVEGVPLPEEMRSLGVATGERLMNMEEGANPEELGDYLEGDIVVPLGRNGVVEKSMMWENGTVPYEITGRFNAQERNMISRAMDEYHEHTCIRFVPKINSDKDYMQITSAQTGCWSLVGKYGGPQQVNLQNPACLYKVGTVIHEMMHLVGFTHEQNRIERDDYVTIMWDNIKKDKFINFKKAEETMSAYGVPYDYGSVMHYTNYSFSFNNKPTILSKTKGVTMGQREGFSSKDIQKIRNMYKCTNNGATGGAPAVPSAPNQEQGGLNGLINMILG